MNLDVFSYSVCVCARARLVPQLSLTLCDPFDCSSPGSSAHGIFQAGTLEWITIFLLQGIFPAPGMKPSLPLLYFWHCRRILYPWAIKEALSYANLWLIFFDTPTHDFASLASIELFLCKIFIYLNANFLLVTISIFYCCLTNHRKSSSLN